MIGIELVNGAGEMRGDEGNNSYNEDFITFAEKHPEFEDEEQLTKAYEQYLEDNK